MITALSQLIGDYFFNSFASIKLIEQIILGLLQVRDVNLTQLALTIKGDCIKMIILTFVILIMILLIAVKFVSFV